MSDSEIERIIQALTHVRKRPGMYFGDGIAPVENFVAGFNLAVQVLLQRSDWNSNSNSIFEKHGLQINRSIYEQLKTRGLDDAEAIEQYLTWIIEDFSDLDVGAKE